MKHQNNMGAAIQIVELAEIGRHLAKIRRKSKGLNQAEVLRRTNMSSGHLSKLENDSRPWDTNELLNIAQAMGIKIAVVVAIEENDLLRLMQPEP